MLNFLNNNAGFVAILVVIVGWALSSITTLILYRRQKKDDEGKDTKERFRHKAEFICSQYFRDNGDNVKKLEATFCTYQSSIGKNGTVIVSYPKELLDKTKIKTKYFYFENIGKSDINELEVAVSNPKATALILESNKKSFMKDGTISYSVSLDQKIRKGEALELIIHYLENDPVLSILSSSLEIYYRDSLHNICRQFFFPEQRKIYEPSLVSQKEWREHVSVNKNLDLWMERLSKNK